MSKSNPFPYGRCDDGSKGCVGCKWLDEIFGMEVYPLCLKKGEDFTCSVVSNKKMDCWEPEEVANGL